jgi:uncharacterized membrane protein YkvA (DUF1232 family)
MATRETKRRVKSLMKFFPSLVALSGRLLADRRVSKADKALLVGSIIYAVSPLDFLPDLIPFIGQVDDAFLIAMTLLRLINGTDEEVVRQHWRGGVDIVQLAGSLGALAPHVLPKRISRVLTARVRMAPDAERKLQVAEATEGKPTVIEVPYE